MDWREFLTKMGKLNDGWANMTQDEKVSVLGNTKIHPEFQNDIIETADLEHEYDHISQRQVSDSMSRMIKRRREEGQKEVDALKKSWELWLEKGRRVTGEVIGWGGKTPSESTHLPAEGNRGGIGLDDKQSKEDVATQARDKVPTRNAPKWVEDKAENQYDRNNIMDELMGDIRLRKSWESWLEKGKKVQLTIAGWNEEAIHQKAPKKKVKFREDDDKGGAWEDSGYAKNASWESWLDKVDESRPDGDDWNDRHLPVPKITIHEVKDEDSFEEKQRKLHQLSNYNDSQDMNDGLIPKNEDIDNTKVKKLLKNNAIETSHKEDEKKEEWDGKFSSSTIEDEVKDDKDDKAVSEEEPLDELTEGKLEEIEKLKSWESWLEKGKWDKFERNVDNSNRAVAINQKENENRDGKVDDREIHSDLTDHVLEDARDVHRPSTSVMDPNFTTKKPRYHKGVEQEGDDIADEQDHLNIEIADSMKSWESWLEKDALDGKGGNEAKDDLMMPSLMGMYKKPTKQTKEGQARDYIRDDHNVESYHSRRLGHGEKYESGKRPLEKKPISGGFVDGTRKEEWDITADQDAQQRGSGRNIFDDKDDNEPSGGFIQGQGRTVPKTGIAPNIKPQGKGVKHRGRPRGSKNKAWEDWLEKDALDGKGANDKIKDPKWTNEVGRKTTKELTVTPKKFLDNAYGKESGEKTNLMDAHSNENMTNHYGDSRHKIGHNPIMGKKEDNRSHDERGVDSYIPIERGDELGDVESKKRKLRRGESMQKPKLTVDTKGKVIDHDGRHRARAAMEEGHETIPIEVHTYDNKHRGRRHHSYARDNIDDLTPESSRKKSWEAWLEKKTTKESNVGTRNGIPYPAARTANEIEASAQQAASTGDVDIGTLTPDMKKKKSWEEWVEKMQGAGDARFGNQHLTGLDQKPVNNEEDEANILPEKEVNPDEKDEKQEETEDKDDKDNKPYKALSHE